MMSEQQILHMQELDEIFKEHHNCMGLDSEEIEDIIAESTFTQRRNWLKKVGYDVDAINF